MDTPQTAEPSPREKFNDAMRKILTVSKPEILKREAEAKRARKNPQPMAE